jgi:hypothetical protein
MEREWVEQASPEPLLAIAATGQRSNPNSRPLIPSPAGRPSARSSGIFLL